MKASAYEIVLPLIGGDGKEIESHALLVNGLYGAMDVVTTEDAEKLATGDFAGISLATRERLLLRGHLTRKDVAGELADLKLLSRIHKTLPGRNGVNLIIMPTYDCNFRCPYCYEQHRLQRGQGWLERVMTDETMEAVFAALEDYRKRSYALGDCTFYGGEPFLEKNFAVAKKIADRCVALGMKLGAITNGYELEPYLDFLSAYDFQNLQITVDGTAETNDRRRIHKDGLPTYDRILRNVELALSCGIGVSLRVNVDRENLSGIGALIDDLKERGFIEKARTAGAKENPATKRGVFSYYFKATTDDAHPEKNIRERDILDELMKYGCTAEEAIDCQSEYSGFAYEMRRLFGKNAYPRFSPANCGSEQGMLVVDPFGRVYPCWDMVAKEETAVGVANLERKRFLWRFSKAKWRTRTVDLMQACQLCPYAFICRGGCASRAASAYGDFSHEYCGETKEVFAFVAPRIAGKEWESRRQHTAADGRGRNHEGELTLSLAGAVSRLTEAERAAIMATTSRKEMFGIVEKLRLFDNEESNRQGGVARGKNQQT